MRKREEFVKKKCVNGEIGNDEERITNVRIGVISVIRCS
jgi:hypothetical protein